MIGIRQEGTTPSGRSAEADILLQLGVMYAMGRDCEPDMVAAHKWLNIAAIRGSMRAEKLRGKLAARMSKAEIARALRQAREWMTVH